MIDICTVVYNNYWILERNIQHFYEHINGEYRFFIADNSSSPQTHITNRWLELPNVAHIEVPNIKRDLEGTSHGMAIDHLLSLTETDIVGTIDSDFFWLDPDILSKTRKLFDEGNSAVGCAGWYPDWQRALDPRHPERAGHLAPVVWGQFIDSSIAKSETFVVQEHEKEMVYETGWRVRDKLIKSGNKMTIFNGFRYDNQSDTETCFFGPADKPVGVHFLKGSIRDIHPKTVDNILSYGVEKWKQM